MGNTLTRPQVGDQLTKVHLDDHHQVTIVLKGEYRGHHGPILDIAVDPFSGNLICSSAQDQTCHLWRLTTMHCVQQLRVPPSTPSHPASFPPRLRCRALQFTSTGQRLYSVWRSSVVPRTSSYVIQWHYAPSPYAAAEDNNGQHQDDQSRDERWRLASVWTRQDDDITAMALSPDDRILILGTSRGTLSAIHALSCASHRKVVSPTSGESCPMIIALAFLDPTRINPHPATTGYLLAVASKDGTLQCRRINYQPLASIPAQLKHRLAQSTAAVSLVSSVVVGLSVSLLGLWIVHPLVLPSSVVWTQGHDLDLLLVCGIISVSVVLLLLCCSKNTTTTTTPHSTASETTVVTTMQRGLWINGLVSLGFALLAAQCGNDRVNLAVVLPNVDPELKASVAMALFGGVSLLCLSGHALLSCCRRD